MSLDEFTIGEAKQMASISPKCAQNSHWKIGKNYLIRTVTMIQTGKLIYAYHQDCCRLAARQFKAKGRENASI